MLKGTIRSRLVAGALLFALLVGVQSVRIAHAFDHDPASLGDTACATCISLSQLATAAVDTGASPSLTIAGPVFLVQYTVAVSAAVPRQRGPPARLLTAD